VEKNKKTTIYLYRGKALEARRKARLRSTLTRIARLTHQLANDIDYATAPSSQRLTQLGQIEYAIRRKQAESRKLLASLPEPYAEELLTLTHAIWRAAATEHRNTPDPTIPLLSHQADLLAKARAELAPTQRQAAALRRAA
jgi:hypothetical protein